jgi:hypothetical protein
MRPMHYVHALDFGVTRRSIAAAHDIVHQKRRTHDLSALLPLLARCGSAVLLRNMSESSVTSSQLDDIDFAVPHTKVYEHQTDVESLFKDTALSGHQKQFRRPELSRGFEQQISSHAVRVTPARENSGDLPDVNKIALGGRRDEPATADIHSRGRIHHDSGAAPDSNSVQRHQFSRASLQSSDASDLLSVHMRDSCGNSTVNVDLLSPAFVLNEHAWQQGATLGLSPAEIVSQRAVTGLGVDHGAIKFFQLKEVQAHEIRAPGRYAVQIDRSGGRSG